jgi:hypothetical protein
MGIFSDSNGQRNNTLASYYIFDLPATPHKCPPHRHPIRNSAERMIRAWPSVIPQNAWCAPGHPSFRRTHDPRLAIRHSAGRMIRAWPSIIPQNAWSAPGHPSFRRAHDPRLAIRHSAERMIRAWPSVIPQSAW